MNNYLFPLISIIIVVCVCMYLTFTAKPVTPQEFEYKHHDYIYFPHKGIVHSPECKQCTLTFKTI